MTTLGRADLADLKRAKALLENPGLASKLSSMLGSPVEKGVKMLPASWQKGVHKATEAALMKALDVAVNSLGERARSASQDRFHRMAAAASGAAGGAFGLGYALRGSDVILNKISVVGLQADGNASLIQVERIVIEGLEQFDHEVGAAAQAKPPA